MVDYISNQDFYEIRLASLVSNVDKDVILELYQPLIGSTATILYLTLLKQKRNEDEENVYQVDKLLNNMQISPGQLLNARHFLEAVGLIRTYEKDDVDNKSYLFVLYAPKAPKDFFDDVLFRGLLIQYIGEKEAKKLAHTYKIDLTISEQYKDVSASFVDVYHPDYDSESFRKDFGKSIVGHTHGRANIEFSYDLFFTYIKENSQISNEVFTKKDMKEISRLSALFGLDEKAMAFIVIDEYNPNDKLHLDFNKVVERANDEVRFRMPSKKPASKSKVSGDGVLAKKIQLMEETSPFDFLRVLQGGSLPAKADLKIVDMLSSNYQFSNGVINTIIDYVLTKNNNILSANYCEKLAAGLARGNVQTAVDAMNFLNKTTTKVIKKVEEKQEEVKIEKEAKTNKVSSSKEVISDEEMDDILSMIENKKKGVN